MTSLQTRNLNQKAQLWAQSGHGDDGQATVAARKELKVRWSEGRTQSVDQAGNIIAVDATVVVDQDVTVESIMWLGSEGGMATDPPTSGLMEVLTFNKVPNVKGRKFRRVVGLGKYSGTLPDLA